MENMNIPEKKRALSFIQSSGLFTLGNYVGALKNWKNMQDDFGSINHFLDKTLSPAKSLRWHRRSARNNRKAGAAEAEAADIQRRGDAAQHRSRPGEKHYLHAVARCGALAACMAA